MTPSGTALPLDTTPALTADDVAGVRALADRAAAADGVPQLSEQTLLQLDDPAATVTHLLVRPAAAGAPVGYAQLDGSAADGATAELIVDPHLRRQGIGGRLLAAVEDAAAAELQVWAHGDTEAARRLAARRGYVRSRVLLQLRRSLDAALPDPVWADGVRVRTFETGRDEQAWLDVNNAAFATHPEQGGWTLHDVAQREQLDWFDPAGVFLAERAGELVGFHWTKVHHEERPPIGEVYIVGVRPQDGGQGLGRALTLAGLHHLRGRGLADVLLYVDEDNVPAVKTYERLGFTRYATDVQYLLQR